MPWSTLTGGGDGFVYGLADGFVFGDEIVPATPCEEAEVSPDIALVQSLEVGEDGLAALNKQGEIVVKRFEVGRLVHARSFRQV